MLEQLKARLVADWRDVGRWWSARMNAIGVVLYPLLISVQAMPPEAQAIFPLKYRAAAAGIYSLAALLWRASTRSRSRPRALHRQSPANPALPRDLRLAAPGQVSARGAACLCRA
jgi:hypothetical protein